MRDLKSHLIFLLRFIRKGLGNAVTYQDTLTWPSGMLEEMLDAGVVVPTSPASIVCCDYCGRGCFVEPEITTLADGSRCGIIFCENIGSIVRFELEVFQRWEIIEQNIVKQGISLPIDDSYISYDEAGAILGVSKPAISNWVKSGKLKDNGLPGQQRKVLKSSVLLEKEHKEHQQLIKDTLEDRKDSWRYED